MANDTLERLRTALHDRYRVERLVGQGGMATVFLAEDLKHHRQVAIKVLRPELSAALGIERFLREIELAAKLQHPHVVPVYDSGEADGMLYYVMPFVEGESLRDLMRREGRVSLPRAAEIVREAASGLAYAHAHGVVHRDVKPENILLSGGHAVVTDFGIARAVDASRQETNLTGAGMAIGTPAYMSPEQATADAVDGRSDQYALACVFYELVTGKQAFSGPTMQAMLTSVLTGPRPRISAVVDGIPPEVDGATQRALGTDPASRFESITAFADAVTQESSGAAAATRESRRWKRLAVVLPLLVAVAAVAWALLFGPGRRVVVSGAETIAVVPFATSGAGLEGIGEGMVDLLAANLDGVGPIRTIEPRATVREWRRRVQGDGGDLDDALAVARDTRAASVLTGSIVATGGTARLTAELYDLDGGRIGGAQVDGPSGSVLALADGLSLALLRDIWKSRQPLPSANASAINSASMPAIRAYLRGERHHRRGEWDSAQVAFEEAVADDSTFALAWYRLANTLGWKGQYANQASLRASANALRYADSLPPRMRSLLVAYDLFARQHHLADDSARTYVQRFPEDADGWYLLGEAQFHGRLMSPMAPEELRRPFDRVLQIDSTLTPAAIHPMQLAAEHRDTALLTRYEAVFRAAQASGELQNTHLTRLALAGSDSAFVALTGQAIGTGFAIAALEGLITSPRADDDSLLAIALGIGRRAPADAQSNQLHTLAGILAGALGRTDTSLTLVRGTPNEQQTLLYLRMLPVFGGYATRAQLDSLDQFFRAVPEQSPFLSIWHAMVLADLGRPAEVRRVLRPHLDREPSNYPPWLGGAMPALDGLAVAAHGDTTGGLARINDGIERTGGVTANGFTMPLSLRVAALQVARTTTRAAGIHRLRYGLPTAPDLIPVAQYYLGRAYEASAKPDSAAMAYGQFLRLWDGADARYAALLSSARDGLARVTGEAESGAAVGGQAP